MYFLLKKVIFHGYVGLPEGTSSNPLSSLKPGCFFGKKFGQVSKLEIGPFHGPSFGRVFGYNFRGKP